MVHGRKRASQRGFSLLELVISLTVLTIALLGIISSQMLASRQNGVGRRTSTAATLLRDFTETAQRWAWEDPRMEPVVACGTKPDAEQAMITPEMLGTEAEPAIKMQYASVVGAGYAAHDNALVHGGTEYKGSAGHITTDDVHQVLWTVVEIDTDPNRDGCEAKLVTVVVRYPTGASNYYDNAITTFVQYNPNSLMSGALREQI